MNNHKKKSTSGFKWTGIDCEEKMKETLRTRFGKYELWLNLFHKEEPKDQNLPDLR